MQLWLVEGAGLAARKSSISTWWDIVWVSKRQWQKGVVQGDDLSAALTGYLSTHQEEIKMPVMDRTSDG